LDLHKENINHIIEDCVNLDKTMPKLKTKKSAAKRFRITGSGKKILRRKANKNHLLEHKTPAQKRRLSQLALVDETNEKEVRLMLPYAK
jgi:large subunit ribosomal protein L35